jgi:two-component system nitrogen regulation sensor histidine kinase GlnL
VIFYCILTSAINAAASCVLALAVYLRRPRRPANTAFCWFAVSGAFWSGAYLLWQTAADAAAALFFCRLLSAGAILIPIAYYRFVGCLLDQAPIPLLRWGYAVSAVLAALSFTPLIVSDTAPKAGFPHWPVPGALYPFYLMVFFGILAASLRDLLVNFRAAVGLQRNQLRFVILGTSVGFLGGATNFFLWYDVPIPPVGNGLVALYVIGVGYAIIRYRLMDFDLFVARAAGYALLVAVLAVPAPLLVRLVALLPFTDLPPVALGPLYLVSLVATALLFAVIPGVRRRADAALEQRVLGDRLADRVRLGQLVHKVSSAADEGAMLQEVVTSVSAALNVAEVTAYTRTDFETDFTRRAAAGPEAVSGREPVRLSEKSPLVRELQQSGRSVLLDEFRHRAGYGDHAQYFKELRRTQGVELAVPIIGDDYFHGFLTLGERSDHALFTEIDVSLLEAIALQIGLNLRARQLERRASQTEKLISLGTLAAGLAHELRNPLVSIRTFTSLLPERGGDPDFQHEFGAIVQRDVNRIASIVENVAAFAENNKVEMKAVEMADVLRAVADILRAELQRSGVELNLPDEALPRVLGNYSQLLQVFLNLIQNAVQAFEGRPGGRITLSAWVRHQEAPSPLLCVSVIDNGPGIDPALLPRIFDPFITTKSTGDRRGKAGMGLGLAIVKRIVQHHHGDVEVSSTPGLGTVFRVLLPYVAESRP